ncbi:MAG: TonB-dependent receptor [Parvularculaceae bacterium]
MCVFVCAAPGWAQESEPAQQAAENCAESCVVSYDLEFFDRYNPVTALDVIRRVPGFSLDEGEQVRGFGGAAGNVLINGRRPSTKNNTISDILGRIPASSVERVDVIRGATGGLDINSQSVVANVITTEIVGRGSGVWEATGRLRRRQLTARGEASYSSSFAGTDYTIGAFRNSFRTNRDAFERLFRAGEGLAELREEEENTEFYGWGGNIQTETALANGDIVRFNGEVSAGRFQQRETSIRTPIAGGAPDTFIRNFSSPGPEFEIGADYERELSERWRIKLISLANREIEDNRSRLDIIRGDGRFTRSESFSDSTSGEQIGRVELDWAPADRHSVQFAGEVANTFVDSDFELFVDTGAGPVRQDVAGANTRVGEMRYEGSGSDSWRVNNQVTVDLSMAVEYSVISQSGENANSRSFVYPKPSLAATYSPNQTTQWRLSAAREVSQLDFNSFISSTNFGDEDIDFGNPDLQPSRTWVFEAVHERRFGEIGIVTLTLGYERVSDVIDQLPIGGIFEVPGNIGDGRRFRGEIEATLPLDRLGLSNGRLDLFARAADTKVTDPVLFTPRRQSRAAPYRWSIEYRQEFPAIRTSWGVSARGRTNEDFFGIDEIDRFGEGGNADAFIEHTFPNNMKVNLGVFNLTSRTERRDRTIFEGSRASGEIDFVEVRRRDEGLRIELELSGAF